MIPFSMKSTLNLFLSLLSRHLERNPLLNEIILICSCSEGYLVFFIISIDKILHDCTGLPDLEAIVVMVDNSGDTYEFVVKLITSEG